MATIHRIPKSLLRAALLTALAVVCGCSSLVGPSSAPPLRSIRYVRTHEVKSAPSQYGVSLGYSLPLWGDPYNRRQTGMVSLRKVDDNTWEFDQPGVFMDIPTDTDCMFWVYDPEVSPNEVARTIYVNGTAIRVQDLTSSVNGQPMELGQFKLGKDGRVY